MYYGEREMLQGVPADENTAMTLRAIKDVLADAGAEHMLMTRSAPKVEDPQVHGPLGFLAAQAARTPEKPSGGLQMPPPVQALRVRPHVAPGAGEITHPPAPIETMDAEEEDAKSGPIARLLGWR
jgi:hypothetical protein